MSKHVKVFLENDWLNCPQKSTFIFNTDKKTLHCATFSLKKTHLNYPSDAEGDTLKWLH